MRIRQREYGSPIHHRLGVRITSQTVAVVRSPIVRSVPAMSVVAIVIRKQARLTDGGRGGRGAPRTRGGGAGAGQAGAAGSRSEVLGSLSMGGAIVPRPVSAAERPRVKCPGYLRLR